MQKDENVIFEENFIRNIKPEYYNKVLKELREVHDIESGWIVDEGIALGENPDGTVRYSFKITRYYDISLVLDEGMRR